MKASEVLGNLTRLPDLMICDVMMPTIDGFSLARMIKGRAPGDAWDELALLAADICATPALPQPALPRAAAR